MKNKLFLATAIIALAACSDNTYLGDENGVNGSGGAISFEMSTPSLTRAKEGAEAALDLKYKFSVYATKTVNSVESNVFAQNVISNTGNTPYWVWYEAGTQNTTQSNTYNWDYVGAKQTWHGPEGYRVRLEADQTIKYWDYSASQYVFTAYSITDGGTVSNVTTNGFKFTGTPAQFAGLYVAEKLTISDKSNPAAHTAKDNKIGDVVKLTFGSSAAKVRLGIYETIPGYNVMNVNFKPYSPASFGETQTSAQLSGSFNGGGTSASETEFTVTYVDNKAHFETTTAASNNFVFGTFDTDGDPYLGETSITPTWANASSDYISVFPNTDHTGNMILFVDFDLYNTTTHETIHVEDAKAVVPAAYMTWKPNYAYTYLFKICDNTNGYTGTETTPTGLYPITFDAVTIATTEVVKEGSITTVSKPSITTYQDGSVSDAGITYANANGAIYITVNTDGTLATLNASGTTVKLYTVADGTTEADLLLASSYPKTEVTSGTDVMTVQTAETTVKSVTFSANQYATFTPTNGNTYAFEYSKEAEADSYIQATGTYVSGTTYYTDSTGASEVDTTGFEEGVTDVSSYYVHKPASSAVKAYKVIKIVAGS